MYSETHAEGTLGELMEYLLPGCTAVASSGNTSCPAWPPDAFAVAASVLSMTGLYIRTVELRREDREWVLEHGEEGGWPKHVATLGTEWRSSLSRLTPMEIKNVASGSGSPVGDPIPEGVSDRWSTLISASALELRLLRPPFPPSGRLEEHLREQAHEVAGALLCVALAADEACSGIGIGPEKNSFLRFARQAVTMKQLESFCVRVNSSKARVLPKQHTPQKGITMRSLTHNLALCPTNDVRPVWLAPTFTADEEGPSGRLELCNLLLLPWPTRIDPKDFQLEPRNDPRLIPLPEKFRFFSYRRGRRQHENPDERLGCLVASLGKSIEVATREVGPIDGIVLPELALRVDEFGRASETARKRGCLLIAGVGVERDEVDGLSAPANMALIDYAGLLPEAQRSEMSGYKQRKHHRWFLESNQVLQYGLGGVVPTTKSTWEVSELGPREVHFLTLDTWLTLCVLLCEDLARQDPVADVLRSVGPNLVVTLLMDAPQLRQRWSARYASVLADDPGSSVLTLTSLGMATRSSAGFPDSKDTRVIALWRDVMSGERELKLPNGADAGVLCLSKKSAQEWSADGRGDGGRAHFPVFAGWHPIEVVPTWP